MDASDCHMWPFADRTLTDSDANEISWLADSIKESGQILPVIAERVEIVGVPKFEIVAGRRRFEACKFVDTPVLVHEYFIKRNHGRVMTSLSRYKRR